MTRAMKDSGIEWIGEIPEDWNIKKIKYCANIYTGNSISDNEKDNYTNPDNAIPYVATKDIDADTNVIDYDNGLYIPYESNFKIAPKNSILLCIEGGSAGRKIAYTNQKVCFVNKLCCFEAFNCNSKFLYYICQSDEFLASFYLQMSGLIGGVSQSAIKNIPVVIPSMPEQEKIADFLDEKCSHIDSVLEKTRASIEEYKQLKQSVITQAVTKGIRPNRPMKDSGIEWIGEIPEDWKVATLKHYIKWKSEKGCPDETVLSLYRDYGVIPKDSRDDNHNVTSLDTSGYKVVDIGDFVVNKMKAWQGSMAISNYRGIISPAYHICTVDSTDINLMYFHYLLRNKSYLPEYTRLSTGMRVGQWDLGFDDLKNIPFIIPSKNEQSEIVEYLECKCTEIDKLITKKEQLVEELETYKKSLIYEYVTGKKEVC